MKTIYLSIFLTLIVIGGNLLVYSQEANLRRNNPDQVLFFTPKSHDPNFLKSAKFPGQSFYQMKSEWKHIIDTTWGPGAPLNEKLLIFNSYVQAVNDYFDGFNSLKLNWDSLYNHYLSQINVSTSKGAFSSIMSHFAYDLKDLHTKAFDESVVFSALNPGVPILLISSFMTVEHFGAVTTVLADSTTLVLRVVPNHPLNIQPGDIILGYEGIPWKNLVKELMNAGLPMFAMTGGCKSADTYHNLMGAGLNWHLFNTIDILKYSTGDTLHLSVEPLLTLNMAPMTNNEQMPVKNIPFPGVLPPRFYPLPDTVVTYGTLENTNIGYIFLSEELPYNKADEQLYKAVNALKNTDALILDMRVNYGGMANFDKAFNVLFNESHKTLVDAHRCNKTSFELCPESWTEWQIKGKDPDNYDRPIAVLLGPSCMSFGDITAKQLSYHPMVRFFGASSGSSYGIYTSIQPFQDWFISYSSLDVFQTSEPDVYLNRTEFPIDYPVWFNKDDVAKGIDPIVEKSLEWINNLAYGHSIVLNKSFFSSEKDTLIATAILENPNSHDVSAKLIFESLDGSVIDSTEMDPLNLEKKNNWQGNWVTNDLAEDLYWISLKVSDPTDISSFTNKHMTRFTTIPLLVDSLPCTDASPSKYTFRPFIKNAGKTKRLSNLKMKITSTDPWVKSISPVQSTFAYLEPGQVRRTPAFSFSGDEASTPNHLNLTISITCDGWPFWVKDTIVSLIPTGIEPTSSLLLTFSLNQNFPNPFNSSTTIGWQLAHGERVTLSVFDIVGRKVATLVDAYRSPGRYETTINAATLPKGIYFYQLKAGKSIQTRKMILLK